VTDGWPGAATSLTEETSPPEQPAVLLSTKSIGRARGSLVALARNEVVSRLATLVAFLVLLGPIYGVILGHRFYNTPALVFDMYENVAPLILSVGIIIPLSCGQFDLSVAPLATLCVFMTIGLPINQGIPLWTAIIIAVAVGLAVGCVNGFLVVRLHINAFIATLATSGVVVGLYTVYSNGATITPSTTTGRFANSFRSFTQFGGFEEKAPAALIWLVVVVLLGSGVVAIVDRYSVSGSRAWRLGISVALGYAIIVGALIYANVPAQISWTILVLLGITWIIWIVLRLTVYGRALYAIGGSVNAANLAGIHVNRYLFSAFVASGGVAALAGVMLAASQGTAVPGLADTFLLPAYAAAFLSTVILSAGRFHVWGTVVGGLFVVWVADGLIQGGVAYTWTDVINGLVLVCAVAFSTALRRSGHR
jgi:ribose/xylose/arabinose/galactoside ABC-type transport system permease subunit